MASIKETAYKICLAIVFVFFSVNIGTAQGILRGKISDNNGEALIGASVVFKENPSMGVTTDFDGNYSIEIPTSASTTLIFAYLGYQEQEQIFTLSAGEVIIYDVTLLTESVALDEVEITAKKERGKTYFMENIKKKSATTLDYVPAELMKKIGDSNVTAAISRVTGVSTNGSFITVRGIGDRYVKTGINGAIIPTLDPFTNNIKLDIFPSSLVDNIVITKTTMPELPGDWAAAYISVETKDFPEKLTISVETQVGYNPQTSFKNVITNQTSKTDWLGFDNGYRDRDHNSFINVKDSPSRYDEMVALGLKNYFSSYGINEKWNEGSMVGEEYFKLGLIGLGLLGKSYINDPLSISQAKNLYFSGNYQNEAYKVINQKAAEIGQAIPNNWNIFHKKAPVNFSQSFSLGNQSKFGKVQLGYLVGFKYGSSIDYDPKSKVTRSILSEINSEGLALVNTDLNQKYAKYTNGWSGLLNVNAKLNPNHSLSLLFMPNITGNNNLRDGVDTTMNTLYKYAYTTSQFYEERRQLTYQLKSEHYLPTSKVKLWSIISYSRGSSSAPDFKNLEYFSDELNSSRFDKTLSDVRRNYRYLNENILDTKFGIDIPVKEKAGEISKLSFGGAYVDTERNFSQHDYFLKFNNGASVILNNNDLDAFFKKESFSIKPNQNIGGRESIDLFYRYDNIPSNNTVGFSKIYATYVQVDKTISRKIRLSGGLRGEYSDIFTDVKVFNEIKLPANDLRRRVDGQAFNVNPAINKSFHLLPSINFIYKIQPNEISPFNARLNFSRTIARPSLREYSETIIYDFELNSDVFGNADLKFVKIDNYDLRLEKYFDNADNLSFSMFYKRFKNHIELLSSNIGFSWTNADISYVYGLEFEARKKIINNLEFRTNISLVKSQTTIKDQTLIIENGEKRWNTLDTLNRAMFGQSPFVINTILNYNIPSVDITATASYNIQGPKLILYTTNDAPDVYEMPRHVIDFKLSKDLNEHFSLSFTTKDILNSPRRRAYKYPTGYILDFDKFRFGTNFTASISYKI